MANKLMEGNTQSQKNKRMMKIAACNYLRNSGKSCRECRYSGTSECVHATNLLNEQLLRA